jgi:hypothetical protein
MGFLSDLTTSPREREGRWRGQALQENFDALFNETGKLQDAFAGIGSLGDVQTKFGIKRRTAKDVSRTFDPARRNLATRLARSRSAAAGRMGSGLATPEAVFAPIESTYADAFGDLESRAAQTGLEVERGDERYAADFLDRIFGNQNQFGLQKQNLLLSNRQAKSAALQDYLNSLDADSTLDDILGIAGTAAKFVKPF